MARAPAPTAVWLVTRADQCARGAEQVQLWPQWVIGQVRAGQRRSRGLPHGTTLLVATAMPHNPHMAVHTLEDRPEDTGHLVVHQRGGPAWLRGHLMALRSWATTVAGAEVRFNDHPATRPKDTLALSSDQWTPAHRNVKWHSAALKAGWLSPTGYYWIPEAWGQTSSDASGGRPCRHATSVALAADLTGTWAVAIPGTVHDGEGVAASFPLQYGTHRPWVHTVDSTSYGMQTASGLRGSPRAQRRRSTRCPCSGLRTACACDRDIEHPFWFARATSHHSDALLHKAD